MVIACLSNASQGFFNASHVRLLSGSKRGGEKQGKQHYGEELRESDEQKAERLIAGTLKKVKWSNEDLKGQRKGDAIKARLANRLRSETTVTWPWIARRLAMGHWRAARNAARKI